MKKSLLGILCALAGIVAGVLISLLFFRFSDRNVTESILGNATPENAVNSASAATEDLISLSLETANYIKNRDFKSLANVVHPDYGVVFSPYATVSVSSNKCFLASEVAAFKGDENLYIWGVTSDIGSPIELTVEDYFSAYVFDRDYTAPNVIGVNSIVKSGNSLENITEVFPNAQFVDLHFLSTNSEVSDWSTLRLVFEDHSGTLRLTAIIHSELTI